MLILSGIALVVIGFLSIFAKDFMWGLTQWNNQAKGVASERTDVWEQGTTAGGVFAILVGVVAVLLGFSGH